MHSNRKTEKRQWKTNAATQRKVEFWVSISQETNNIPLCKQSTANRVGDVFFECASVVSFHPASSQHKQVGEASHLYLFITFWVLAIGDKVNTLLQTPPLPPSPTFPPCTHILSVYRQNDNLYSEYFSRTWLLTYTDTQVYKQHTCRLSGQRAWARESAQRPVNLK